MPGQNKTFFNFERPVTRSQTKKSSTNNAFTSSKGNFSERQNSFVPTIYEHKVRKSSSSTYTRVSKASSKSSNYSIAHNQRHSSTTNSWKNKSNKLCEEKSSRDFNYTTYHHSSNESKSNNTCQGSFRFSNRTSDWSPETPEKTPDLLSEYGFEDVFDRAFAHATAQSPDYPSSHFDQLNSASSSSAYSPISPLSPHSLVDIENDSDESEEIIDIESLSPPPKSTLNIGDDLEVPLKYRFEMDSETCSESGDLITDLMNTEYLTPKSIDDDFELVDTPVPCSIDRGEEIEDLVLLDNERVTDPYSMTEKKQPITREHLLIIKNGLDLEDTEQAMFWCLCTLAFHSLARLNELVTDTQAADPLQIEVKQVKAPNIYVVPYACIRIPYQKNETAKIRHLIVCPSNDEVCPLTALSNYCRIRTQEGYASDKDPFFCFKGGKATSRKWFLDTIKPFLPHDGQSFSYSFRAGGVLDLVSQGRTKPDIRCLGRWDYNTFEQYLNEHPSILLAFISASINNAYEMATL